MTRIALALGGNIGQMEDTFNEVIILLMKAGLKDIRVSSILSNPAVGCIEGTPDFKNAALTANWEKSAEELFGICQKIEQTLGRPKEHKSNMSRTIDIDIILFGDEIIDIPGLKIPHSRAQKRGFVLIPLNQLSPDWIFPDTKKSVSESLALITHYK